MAWICRQLAWRTVAPPEGLPLGSAAGLAIVIALGLATGSAGSGCNPAIYISGEQTVNARLRSRSLDELTRTFNRQVEVARDIQISATLWDMAYIVAFQEARATSSDQGAEAVRRNIEAWRVRFVAGQTAFRVRVELLNRGEVVSGTDRILRMDQWSWRLKLSDGKVVPYSNIHVELSKRFRTAKGLYHHRLDGVVHFSVRPDPAIHRFVELWAYPPGDRPAARLRWNLKRP